jgi:hypothetical protein
MGRMHQIGSHERRSRTWAHAAREGQDALSFFFGMPACLRCHYPYIPVCTSFLSEF